jgi:hypothetical protein
LLSRRWPEWADATIVLICTGLVGARQGNQLDWLWSDPTISQATWLPLLLTSAAGFFGAFQPFRLLHEKRRGPLRLVWERRLLHVLGELVVRCQELASQDRSVGKDTTIGIGDLGLHVWKKSWRIDYKWPFIRCELERLRTVRLGSLPALRQIRFYKGKGIIGRCWQLNDEVIEDIPARFANVQSETDWNKLSPAERDRFSYREFMQTRDRGAILASPVRDRSGKFIGCVSVDIGKGVHILRDRSLRNTVQHLCIGVGQSYFEGLE